MFIKVVLLIIVSGACFCEICNFEENISQLSCSGIPFSNINTIFYNRKNDIKTFIAENCVLPKLEAAQIPFNNVRHMTLTCDIKELSGNSFSNLQHLQSLNLSHNVLVDIPNNFYHTTLKTLDLSHNRLRNLTIDSLRYLTNLKELDLSFNKITNIDLGVLDPIPNIIKLFLNNNDIHVIQLGAFDKITTVQELDISNNKILSLPLGMFDSNINLKQLKIGKNQIDMLPIDIFKNNLQLQLLDINGCKLLNFEGIFKHLINLITLNISGNVAGNLKVGIFDPLESLEDLDLSNMGISTLPEGIFDKIHELKRLNIHHNNITELPVTIINRTQVEYFNISHNQLTGLPTELFQWTNLKVIDISYNVIEELQTDLLNLDTVVEVHARSNRIYHLQADTFPTCEDIGHPLKYLDMRDNRLGFVEAEFFECIENLEQFEITGNPWDCKCFDELLGMLGKRFITYTRDEYFDGKKSVCVPVNPFKCTFEIKDIKNYYQIWSQGRN